MADIDLESLKQVAQLQESINKLLKDQSVIFEKILNQQSQQVKTMLEVQTAASNLGNALGEVEDSAAGAASSENVRNLNQLAKALKLSGKATQDASGAMVQYEKKSEKLVRSITIATAALGGLVQGFKNTFALLRGGFGLFESAARGLFSVGKAIIGIPLGILKSFVNMATSGGGGNELAEAYENLRDKFGAAGQAWSQFTTKTSSAVVTTAKNLSGFSDTGLSVYRTFGNLAERIKMLTELAEGMGKQFSDNAQEFKENGGALLAYQKGLGLSAEEMANVAVAGKYMGGGMGPVLLSMTKQAMGMAKAFDLDAKVLSRDMGKALGDVAHFGHLTKQALMENVTYANKLGISIEKITGLMDQFDTFDKAAESAGALAEQIGINVDAMDLLDADSAAKKLEIFRKAMQSSGKDFNQMDQFQRKILANQIGLDQGTLALAFSQDKLGVSLEEIQKQGDKNEATTMTQADAMHELAGSIRQMTQAGSFESKSFLGRFLEGFKKGVMSSQEFWDIINKINRSLMIVYTKGFEIGNMLASTAGPFRDFLRSVGAIFDPARFQKLGDGMVALVKKFMGPNGDIINNFDEFMNGKGGLKELFFNFFDSGKPAGMKFLDNVKKMMLFAVKLISKGVLWAIDELAGIVPKITAFIKNPDLPGAVDASPWVKPLLDIFKSFKDKLWPVLVDLFDALWEKLKPYLVKGLTALTPIIATSLFGPAFGRAMFAAFAESVGKFFMAQATSLLTKKFAEMGAKTAASGVPSTVQDAASQVQKAAGTLPKDGVSPNELMQKSVPDQKTAEELARVSKIKIDGKEIAKVLGAFAAVLAIGIAAVLGAIVLLRAIKATPTEVAEALATVVAISGAFLTMSAAMALMSKVKIDAESVGIGIAAVAIAAMLMAATMAQIYVGFSILKYFDANVFGNMKKVGEILFEMSKVFAVAGLVVLEATAIGALITATAGIGAGMMAVGMAAMATAIETIAVTTIGVMKQINDVKVDAGFGEKSKIFIDVTRGVMDLIKVLGEVLTAASPSITSLLLGGDSTVKNIQAVTKLATDVIGSANQKTGLMGLVSTILDVAKDISAKEATLSAAKTIADIMGAVGPIASALKPPDKFFETISGWTTTAEDVNKGLTQLAEYARTSSSGIVSVITAVSTLAQSLAGWTPAQVEAAKAVGPLLSGIATISQALQPSPAVIQALRTVDGKESSVSPENLNAAGTLITKVSDGLKEVLPAIIKSLNPLLQSIGQWKFTESETKALQAISPVLQTIFQMVQAVTGHSAQLAEAKVPGVDIGNFIDKIGAVIPKIFSSISEKMPELFGSIKNSVIKLAQGTDPGVLKQGIDVFKNVISVVTEMPRLAAAMGELRTTLDKPGAEAFDASMLTKVQNFLSGPTQLIAAIEQNYSKKIDMGAGLQNLKSYSDYLSTVKDRFSNIQLSLESIKSITAEVQKISDAILQVPDIKLEANLKPVAAIGVGGKFEYNIKSEPVNININMEVLMKASDVEQTILFHPNSVIADRINLAIEHGNYKLSPHGSDAAFLNKKGAVAGFAGKSNPAAKGP